MAFSNISTRQKTEHAGHFRYILSTNPKRYDCYGDELDEEDDDNNVDAISLADNAYSDLKIEGLCSPWIFWDETNEDEREEILKPLTSATELPSHPSMSNVYTSPVLDHMVQQARDIVQREEKTLWHVKKLAMAFRGDQDRVTGLEICSVTDPSCFEPKGSSAPSHATTQTQSKAQNGSATSNENVRPYGGRLDKTIKSIQQQSRSNETENSHHAGTDPSTTTNPTSESPNWKDRDEPVASQVGRDLDTETQNPASNSDLAIDGGMDKTSDQADRDDSVAHEQDNGMKIPYHRMTTRAQAHTASDKAIPSAPRSPSPAISETASIHPIFQIPPSAVPDIDRGLPPLEAEETRAILFLWVQKQEEVARGALRMYEGLLKASRLRKSVFAWCKAEGHLGEMSDGEDWYDKEDWGLDEDLRKGQEEEEDETVNPSKKTRGRRAQ